MEVKINRIMHDRCCGALDIEISDEEREIIKETFKTCKSKTELWRRINKLNNVPVQIEDKCVDPTYILWHIFSGVLFPKKNI